MEYGWVDASHSMAYRDYPVYDLEVGQLDLVVFVDKGITIVDAVNGSYKETPIEYVAAKKPLAFSATGYIMINKVLFV